MALWRGYCAKRFELEVSTCDSHVIVFINTYSMYLHMLYPHKIHIRVNFYRTGHLCHLLVFTSINRTQSKGNQGRRNTQRGKDINEFAPNTPRSQRRASKNAQDQYQKEKRLVSFRRKAQN